MAKSGAERMREFRARNREKDMKELLVLYIAGVAAIFNYQTM